MFSSDRDDPNGDLYVVNADGSNLTRLTNSPGYDWVGSQAWSPDGARIVFTSARDNPSGEIYVMKADGSGVVRLTRNTVSDISPAWSPDGSSIAFVRWTDGVGDIYRMSAFDGSSIFKVATNGHDPAWSPDGSKIAFGWGNDPWGYDVIPDLAVIDINGTGFVHWRSQLSSTDYPARPSWSPDGTWIAIDRGCCGVPSVMTIVRFAKNRFGESIDIGGGESPSWR